MTVSCAAQETCCGTLTPRTGTWQTKSTMNSVPKSEKDGGTLTSHLRVSHSHIPLAYKVCLSDKHSRGSVTCRMAGDFRRGRRQRVSPEGNWNARERAYAEHWSLQATGTLAALSSVWDAVVEEVMVVSVVVAVTQLARLCYTRASNSLYLGLWFV